MMRAIDLGRVPFVKILDAVAERIGGQCELLGENMGRVIGVSDYRRILPIRFHASRAWRSVDADKPIFLRTSQ